MVGGNAAGVGCGGIAGRERGDPAADEGADGHSTVGGLRWGGRWSAPIRRYLLQTTND